MKEFSDLCDRLRGMKQLSHYLRSPMISIHSSISLLLLKLKDSIAQEELVLVRDQYIQQELSRIDMVYYSTLDRDELLSISQHFSTKGTLKNIQARSFKKVFLSRISFLLHTISPLIQKMSITTQEQHIKCSVFVEDHNDNAFTVELFAKILKIILKLKNYQLSKNSWGYELLFSI